ncbi:hypothetical protein [Endozoicomonas lisbonensis]|uniref:Uncharacterized protein n=1 Tax=Endozoicomonas lisbonensis TaxID=3120522 RepID=A0ABV2SEB5_9GAMM
MAKVLHNGEETVEFLEEENLIKVTLPIRLYHRGGKTTIETPTGAIDPPEMKQLQIALIQGHRWLKMLIRRKFPSVKALAEKEKVDKARISKCIRLTCLAPDIQEDILCYQGKWHLSMKECMKPFPMLWSEQREHFSQDSVQ